VTSVCSVSVAAIAAGPIAAQDYPVKPIRVVIAAGAGGSSDTVARIVGDRLAGVLGQQLIYDNRPGASGIIAAELVAKAPPDGYTMLLGTAGAISVNVSLYR
jgi:tripartite-type tricarboxylate transporter receptor subunit TctC